MRDDVFVRSNVPMTKREIRAISLEYLDIKDGMSVLDIGGGTGSISVEIGHSNLNSKIMTIESNSVAVDLIHKNIEKFNLENIEVIKNKAPIQLDRKFDRVFVGGSGGQLIDILKWIVDDVLTDKGIIVLNFIVLDNLVVAINFLKEQSDFEIEGCQSHTSLLSFLGEKPYFKPTNQSYIIVAKRKLK